MGTLQAVQIHFKLTFVIFEMAVLAVVFNYFGEITVDSVFDYKFDKTLLEHLVCIYMHPHKLARLVYSTC